MKALEQAADPVMQSVIQEIQAEIDLFEQCSDAYGYSVYQLRCP
jgi:hypothetical protein